MKIFAKYVSLAASIAAFVVAAAPLAHAAGSYTQITGSANVAVSNNAARSSGLCDSAGHCDPAGHIEIIGNDLYAMGRLGNVAKWNVPLTESANPNANPGWTVFAGEGGTDSFARDVNGKFYVMGKDGYVRRWDGSSYTQITAVFAARSSGLGDPAGHIEIIDGYLHAMGRDGSVAKWKAPLAGAIDLNIGWEEVAGKGGTDVFARGPDKNGVSNNAFYVMGNDGYVRRWDGSSYTQITGGNGNQARSSGLCDSAGHCDPAGHIEIIGNDLYAMGRLGNVAKWNVPLTGSANPNANPGWTVVAGEGGTDSFARDANGKFYVMGRDGYVRRWDETTGASNYTLTLTKSGTGSGTATSSPVGIDCGPTCAGGVSYTFTSGTAVILTARPASGSTFTGWSGDCSGTGTCSVTMNAAKSVTAMFSGSGPAPTVVTSCAGTSSSASQATVSWASTNDATGYAVEIDTDSNTANGYWTKFVPTSAGQTSTIAPGGFDAAAGASGPLILNSGSSYKARIYYYIDGHRSSEAAFTAQVCGSTVFEFSLGLAQSNVSVVRGSSVTDTIAAVLASGGTQSVSFTTSGLPTGATATSSPTYCNPTCTSTITINTLATTPVGTSTIMVTGTAGSVTHTIPLTLTVKNPIDEGGGNDGSATPALRNGDSVRTTSRLKIRSAPSTGSSIRPGSPAPAGSTGRINCSATPPSGVTAPVLNQNCPTVFQGAVWWYVDYDGSLSGGWSAEQFGESEGLLEKYTPAATTLNLGDRVRPIIEGLRIRSSPEIPATNPTANIVGTANFLANHQGVIVGGPRTANGLTWWQIDWDGTLPPTGWSAESAAGTTFLVKI